MMRSQKDDVGRRYAVHVLIHANGRNVRDIAHGHADGMAIAQRHRFGAQKINEQSAKVELSTDKLGWDDPKRGPRRPWAIINQHNTVVFLTLSRDEAAMWTWWLGWPDADDIIAKQREGFRAVPVTVAV